MLAQHLLDLFNKKRESTHPLPPPPTACYSHPGIDVKLMSIHHCLSLKLPDVVADIKINAVLQPFIANQLETLNTQNQFIDQALKITLGLLPRFTLDNFMILINVVSICVIMQSSGKVETQFCSNKLGIFRLRKEIGYFE